MARPKRKPRAEDRIVLAYRDRLIGQGYLDVIRGKNRVVTAVKVFGTTYGPGHEPLVGAERLQIHIGRGRPPAGSIGLIAAIAAATGYSTRVVLRALSGAPRAGRGTRIPSVCPHCGHDPAATPLPPAPLASPGASGRGLEAIGLTDAKSAHKPAVDPLRGCRDALVEALDAAIGMDAVHGEVAALAKRLQQALEASA